MEFAQAAQGARAAGDPRGGGDPRRRAAGQRPRARRRSGADAGGGGGRGRPAPHAARARRARVAQPLPAAHPRARAHARPARAAAVLGRPARHARRRARPRRGARLPDRLRRATACATSRRLRRLLRGLRPRRPPRRAAAPLRPPRPRAQPRAGALAAPAGRALRGDRRRPRARARARAGCRTPSSPSASTRRSTPPSRCAAATTATCSPRRQAMAARFADHPDAVAETARLADALRFDLTERPRLPLPGRRGRPGRRDAGARLRTRASTSATRPATGCASEAAARAWTRSCGLIAELGLSGFFLLHRDMLELAREVAVEVRGPDTARALLPPGRGRGSSVSSIVCYLTGLSHVDPIANDLFLGRFLNEEITALPDIDLDFPRDVREVLIPRVHERYGRDRSALVAAFPTYRARGAIRELGKALGLPPGEIERVARGSEGWSARAGRPRRRRRAGRASGTAEGRWALARAPGRRGPRPAAPPLPALGRDDRRHPPAGRLLPGRPRRDGGPADGHVGQGLVRRRGLPEDRPARPGDALGRRALRGADRARGAASASTSRASPTTTRRSTTSIQKAETTGVFQIESRAQMALAAAHAARERSRTSRSRSRSCGPGPIQGGAVNPYIERRQRLRADPDLRGALRPPVAASRCCATRSGRSSSRTR